MSDQPQQSGRDLARQALAAYKATRRTHPAGKPATKPRTRSRDRGSGRDPVAFGAVLGTLGAEQGWDTALKGGSLTDRWATICPTQYAGKLRPTAFDPASGTLQLVTDSPAVATDLRILGSMLIQHLNKQLPASAGKGPIRRLAVQLGSVADRSPATAPTPPGPAPELAPVRTREAASPGYQRARAAALAHKPDRDHLLDEKLRAAIAAGDRWLADPANREPEDAFPDAVEAQERAAAAVGPTPGTLEAAVAAALAYKYEGGHRREPRRLFEAS
ncbi:DciA family protein [Streptomyces lavendofoliae]|uniref:DUF721 domain-containing protein n=1 Tax=Streptomyces lavendofoliae TaxID=67314 RepID=A0A918I3S4_9ACTN|nr:DUF721 domain-containing protein [Streptomyces lavendofoliae]GGU62008.1 hypothetical protein GCM10010274_58470 [Streptomyces lavendofoliae]